jgi:hypothetical protein
MLLDSFLLALSLSPLSLSPRLSLTFPSYLSFRPCTLDTHVYKHNCTFDITHSLSKQIGQFLFTFIAGIISLQQLPLCPFRTPPPSFSRRHTDTAQDRLQCSTSVVNTAVNFGRFDTYLVADPLAFNVVPWQAETAADASLILIQGHQTSYEAMNELHGSESSPWETTIQEPRSVPFY